VKYSGTESRRSGKTAKLGGQRNGGTAETSPGGEKMTKKVFVPAGNKGGRKG